MGGGASVSCAALVYPPPDSAARNPAKAILLATGVPTCQHNILILVRELFTAALLSVKPRDSIFFADPEGTKTTKRVGLEFGIIRLDVGAHGLELGFWAAQTRSGASRGQNREKRKADDGTTDDGTTEAQDDGTIKGQRISFQPIRLKAGPIRP